ncbi:MAG: superoxide dismutase family protein [Phycisphaeraceae bacterium]
MQHRSFLYAAILCVPVALIWSGCGNGGSNQANGNDAHEHHDPFKGVNHAVCVLSATEGNSVAGVIHFNEKDGKVTITGEVTGLKPDQKHAIHVHEFGDISKGDGMGTDGHYNPEGHDHALPDKDKRHAGDLGNLQADAQGKAKVEITVNNITVAGEKNPILGRAIIVHEKEDTGKGATGEAGARIAQGVIGIAK